jgi:hypothetical protein
MAQENENRSLLIKSVPLVFLFMVAVTPLQGQGDYQSFYNGSLKINNTGMYILGTWALANIAAGAYGWAVSTGEMKYFGQMNLFWNAVNLSIAGFALYGNYTTDLSLMTGKEMLAKHLKTENILLINSALDVGYIGAGFLMRHLSAGSAKRGDLLKGYGNSVIMQGAFLLVFDLVMYGILRGYRTDFMEGINLAVTTESIMVGLRINL